MYLQHFALTRYPFQTMEHPDELFKSKAASETETRLLHLLELRGIGLLTGEVGCGKTTACRQVTAGLHPGLYRVYYVSLTTGSILDTYQVKGSRMQVIRNCRELRTTLSSRTPIIR